MNKLLLALVASLVAFPAAAADFDCATLPLLSRWAVYGDVQAQTGLASLYLLGKCVEQDYSEAARWAQSAVSSGDAGAEFILSGLYLEGLGVQKNTAEAVMWLRKSAEHGNAKAQGQLGMAYVVGKFVRTDYDEALKWLRLACSNGDKASCDFLDQVRVELQKRFR